MIRRPGSKALRLPVFFRKLSSIFIKSSWNQGNGLSMAKITFGTSGWRAIIAEDFTFANVKIAVAAIAQYLQQNGEASKGLVVAGDYRFMSEEFVKATVQVLAGHGITSYVCPIGTPTPTVSYELLRRKAAGAINFTASHNPAQ